MNQDVTFSLERALGRSWSRQQAEAALAFLSTATPEAMPDWDHGAGEQWARILLNNEVVAYLSMVAPIVIGLRDLGLRTRPIPGAPCLIEVQSMDAADLSIRRDLLQRLAGRSISDVVDSNSLSPDELVWATM